MKRRSAATLVAGIALAACGHERITTATPSVDGRRHLVADHDPRRRALRRRIPCPAGVPWDGGSTQQAKSERAARGTDRYSYRCE